MRMRSRRCTTGRQRGRTVDVDQPLDWLRLTDGHVDNGGDERRAARTLQQKHLATRQTDRDIVAQTGVQTSLRDIIYALILLVGRQEEYAACKS